ncbi:MAG TPA: DUF6541 family protein [Herpetosiphonaceae bacterium]
MSSTPTVIAARSPGRALASYRTFLSGAAGLALLLSLFSGSARFAICALLLLFGPGFLVETWLGLELPHLARPAVWLGISMAAVPVLYLWLPALGLTLRAAWFVALPLLAAGVFLRLWARPPELLPRGQGLSAALLATLAAILALTAWTRWLHIRGLVFPVWVDSVHHALMIRVMAETGRPPLSLRPYLPVDGLSYHWGYHSLAAPLVVLSGLSVPTVMLWLGQLLGTLHVLAVGGAAAVLFRRPVAALGAGLVVGLVSIMPAFFVSWGRYTLLAGLLLLPAVLIVSWEWLRRPGWKGVAVLALLLAGLNLIHIVAFSIAAVWCAAAWLVGPADSRWRLFGRLAAAGTAALVLTGPWIELLVRQTIATRGSGPMTLNGNDQINSLRDAQGLLWTMDNPKLVGLALLAALLAIYRRQRAAAAIVVWWALVLLAANPVWIGLPYLSFFNNTIIAIAIFVPFTLLLGGGLAALDDLLAGLADRPPPAESAGEPAAARRRRAVRTWRAARNMLLLAFATTQAFGFREVINGDTITANADDLAAITWLARNTPPDARFALNTIPWNRYGVARATDGGWWALILAGRQVSTPPVVYTFGTQAYRDQVRAVTGWLSDAENKTPAELAAWMSQNGYAYAYASDKGRIFDGAELAAAPEFQQIYHEGRVWIYRLKAAP